MRILAGNLWNFDRIGNAIVLPGNIGWTKRGLNVMGAGVAKEAAMRYPQLPQLIGAYCQQAKYSSSVYQVFADYHLFIFFPVKPLNPVSPYLSWRNPASLTLISRSCQALAHMDERGQIKVQDVYLPLVGCGNGGRSPLDVYPILSENLSDRFTLVLRQDSVALFKEQGWMS